MCTIIGGERENISLLWYFKKMNVVTLDTFVYIYKPMQFLIYLTFTYKSLIIAFETSVKHNNSKFERVTFWMFFSISTYQYLRNLLVLIHLVLFKRSL